MGASNAARRREVLLPYRVGALFCLGLRCSSIVPERRDEYASSSTAYQAERSGRPS